MPFRNQHTTSAAIPADSTAYNTAATAVVGTLTIAPTTLSVAASATGTAGVTAKDRHRHSMPVPNTAVAHSSNTAKATVTLLNGVLTITGVAAGTTNITVTQGGVTSNTLAVTVTP